MSPEERKADLKRRRQDLRDAIAAQRWYTQTIASDLARAMARSGLTDGPGGFYDRLATLTPPPTPDGVYVITTLE